MTGKRTHRNNKLLLRCAYCVEIQIKIIGHRKYRRENILFTIQNNTHQNKEPSYTGKVLDKEQFVSDKITLPGNCEKHSHADTNTLQS